jgi:hypothetical protein
MWYIATLATFIFVCFVLLIVCSGCGTIDEQIQKFVDEKIKEELINAEQSAAAPEKEEAQDEIFNAFIWRYGGFNGSGAKIESSAKIDALNVHKNGLSYQWKIGGCEELGAKTNKDHNNTLACLFCKINGEWIGGKFDWISTSRTTRDFENIHGKHAGYNGWDSQAIEQATEFAFVIVSKDGRKRTNVIFAKGLNK